MPGSCTGLRARCGDILLCFIFNSLTLLFYEWNRIGFVVLGGDGVAILQWSRELAIFITRSGFDGDLMSAGMVRRGRGFVAWHGGSALGAGRMRIAAHFRLV